MITGVMQPGCSPAFHDQLVDQALACKLLAEGAFCLLSRPEYDAIGCLDEQKRCALFPPLTRSQLRRNDETSSGSEEGKERGVHGPMVPVEVSWFRAE